MIIGIGTDIIEIDRVKKACEKEAFLKYIYTEAECRQTGESSSKLAGNFAVKEAVSKAIGTGFRGFMPIDIEVFRDELGKPYVKLSEKAQNMADKAGIKNFHVSISNTDELVIAYVIGEGDKL